MHLIKFVYSSLNAFTSKNTSKRERVRSVVYSPTFSEIIRKMLEYRRRRIYNSPTLNKPDYVSFSTDYTMSEKMMAQSTLNHKSTQWKHIRITDMSVEKNEEAPNSLVSLKIVYYYYCSYSYMLTDWVAHLRDGSLLYPSHRVVPKDFRKECAYGYFLIDMDDVGGVTFLEKSARNFSWTGEQVKKVSNLTSFTEMISLVSHGSFKKKMYLRVVPPIKSDDEPRVFIDELAEMVPILREQQGNPFENPMTPQLNIYRKLGFGDHIPEIQRFGRSNITTPFSALKRILEEYDIDKTLLTVSSNNQATEFHSVRLQLVDDPGFIIGTERSMRNGGSYYLLNKWSNPVISRSQATLMLVQSLVANVNWKRASYSSKEEVINEISDFALVTEGFFFDMSTVLRKIVDIKKNNGGLYKGIKKLNIIFPKMQPYHTVEIGQYKEMCREYGITEKVLENDVIHVWVLRGMLMTGCIESVFTGECCLSLLKPLIVDTVLDAMMSRFPNDYRDFICHNSNTKFAKRNWKVILGPRCPNCNKTRVEVLLAETAFNTKNVKCYSSLKEKEIAVKARNELKIKNFRKQANLRSLLRESMRKATAIQKELADLELSYGGTLPNDDLNKIISELQVEYFNQKETFDKLKSSLSRAKMEMMTPYEQVQYGKEVVNIHLRRMQISIAQSQNARQSSATSTSTA
ncbi:hypothetical protein CRE_08491 [Caenorhabditis remanei]|uniref:Uncharacterized protein n=1 Tax=Caenorhabditis remanei TaxID=31234 RepID=E3N6W5_CAERE|nr:hypothetical protein CRE_08491 [Caenorhabditis remanei]